MRRRPDGALLLEDGSVERNAHRSPREMHVHVVTRRLLGRARRTAGVGEERLEDDGLDYAHSSRPIHSPT
jgi:hypothetical protein